MYSEIDCLAKRKDKAPFTNIHVSPRYNHCAASQWLAHALSQNLNFKKVA